MKDKDGVQLGEGDLVIYIAKDRDGHGALFEGRVVTSKPEYVVIENGETAYVCRYPSRVVFIEPPDDADE